MQRERSYVYKILNESELCELDYLAELLAEPDRLTECIYAIIISMNKYSFKKED